MKGKVIVKNKAKQTKTSFEAFAEVQAKDSGSTNRVLVEMGKPEQIECS